MEIKAKLKALLHRHKTIPKDPSRIVVKMVLISDGLVVDVHVERGTTIHELLWKLNRGVMPRLQYLLGSDKIDSHRVPITQPITADGCRVTVIRAARGSGPPPPEGLLPTHIEVDVVTDYKIHRLIMDKDSQAIEAFYKLDYMGQQYPHPADLHCNGSPIGFDKVLTNNCKLHWNQ
jgi:hypothetical protein